MEAAPPNADDPKAKYAARDSETAQRLVKKYQALEGERQPLDVIWQEISEKFSPRKAQIQTQRQSPDISLEAQIFDTTPIDSLNIMAAGLMAWTTPSAERWFALDPAMSVRKSDRVSLWLQDCGQVMQRFMANSNFYTERHEGLLNKCGFGTDSMICEMEEGELRFETFPIGSYCIEENHFGRVDSFYRKFPLTAMQAVEKFGEDAVSEKTRLMAKDVTRQHMAVDFLHAIYPRPKKDIPDTANRAAAIFKPYASCYVEFGEKRLVREGGYDSFPITAGRYERWNTFGFRSPWGYSPAFAALPDARQINFLSAMMDVAIERAVDPAMLIPEEMEGEIITTARGLNFFSSGVTGDRMPRELYKVPPLEYGEALLERKKKSIEAKFHVELFKMFAQIERQMTAREVAERAGERLTLITPAFTRDTTESCAPMLRRVFLLLAEAGQLPPPPPEAVVAMRGSMLEVPDPEISFTSRLALAINEMHMLGADRTFEWVLAVGQVRPDVWDNFSIDKTARKKALVSGMSSDLLIDEDEMAATRKARAEAMAKQQQMMMLEQGAKAVGAVGGIPAIKEVMQ